MVSTQDSESCDPSLNLGGTWFFFSTADLFFTSTLSVVLFKVIALENIYDGVAEKLKAKALVPCRGEFEYHFLWEFFSPTSPQVKLLSISENSF